MVELVPPEEEAFEAEEPEEMIDPGHPLGHPGVVGVFRFEQELEETSGGRRGETSLASGEAAVGPDSPKSRVAIGDQLQANVVVCEGRLRRTEDRSNEAVIEVRGPQGELRLLQRLQTVMMPGSLLENGKGKRVPSKKPGVRLPSLADVGEKLRTEQPGQGRHWLEHTDPTEDRPAIG